MASMSFYAACVVELAAPTTAPSDGDLPLCDGLERADARDVKDDHGANGLLVVDARHVAESLLAGNVPELEAHFGVWVPANDLERKVDADLRAASDFLNQHAHKLHQRHSSRPRTVDL